MEEGKLITLGAILGNPLEPSLRMGRVVGIFKDRKSWAVVHRRFLPGDGKWPTGGWYTTSFNVEWTGEEVE